MLQYAACCVSFIIEDATIAVNSPRANRKSTENRANGTHPAGMVIAMIYIGNPVHNE